MDNPNLDIQQPTEFRVEGDNEELINGDGNARPVESTKKSSSEDSPLHSNKITSGKDLSESRGLRIIVICVVIFSALVTFALILTIIFGEPEVGGNAAVAASDKMCSSMGVDILRQGGSAADAMVTTVLCLGVVNSHASGIGGGGFALIHDHKNHKSQVYDFRETAPASASGDIVKGTSNLKLQGGSSVAIPGELKGLQKIHNEYGRLKWKTLVEPVAEMARNGFRISKSMGLALQSGDLTSKDLEGPIKDLFVDENGDFLPESATIKMPKLAGALDKISENGADALYDGELTDSVLDSVNFGSDKDLMTREDLKNYEVKTRDVIKVPFGGKTLLSTPLPSSGYLLLSLMKLLDGYSFTTADKRKLLTYERMIQAEKFIFASQHQLGDPNFDKDGVLKNITDKLLSDHELENTRSLIDASNATLEPDETGTCNGDLYTNLDQESSHVSIVDSQELMISLTTSINDKFGSRLMTRSGIILNNHMNSFYIPNSATHQPKNMANIIEPGKRPLSNMAPAMLIDEEKPCSLRMVVGASKGQYTLPSAMQVLMNIAVFGGGNLTAATSDIRITYEPFKCETEFEMGFPSSVLDGLTALKHKMVAVSQGLGSVQSVMKINNTLQAASDPREGGVAATLV